MFHVNIFLTQCVNKFLKIFKKMMLFFLFYYEGRTKLQCIVVITPVCAIGVQSIKAEKLYLPKENEPNEIKDEKNND